MTDEERQLDEIEVLESIYDKDLAIKSRWPMAGCLRISPTSYTEETTMNVISMIDGHPLEKNFKIRYFVPIELYFRCPSDYPSRSQPLFMLKCIWLSESSLSTMCHQLDLIWDRHQNEILFEWATFLKDTCSFLKIEKLHFSNKVNHSDSSFLPRIKDNLKLKALRSETYNKELILDKCVGRRPYKRAGKLNNNQNFKYETPKDLENQKKSAAQERLRADSKSDNKATSSSSPRGSYSSSISTFEYILHQMTMYGVRCKNLIDESDGRIISTSSNEHSSIVQKMIDYNDDCLDKVFRLDWHFCDICFEQKQGSDCVRLLPCSHIFCLECVRQYLVINITNGNVFPLCCPNIDCNVSLSSSQINKIVDDEIFTKYETFSEKLAVEKDPTLMNCPRVMCQSVARQCSELSPDMYYCARCCYYFCKFCKRVYHGVQVCQLKNDEKKKVVQEYQNANATRKAELEKRYTKKQISKWVDEYLTDKWIEEKSKPCPNCHARIQKNDGCNKMMCSNCSIPFCWLCGTCLSTAMPYAHFNDPKLKCYQKLFSTDDNRELNLENMDEEIFFGGEYDDEFYLDYYDSESDDNDPVFV